VLIGRVVHALPGRGQVQNLSLLLHFILACYGPIAPPGTRGPAPHEAAAPNLSILAIMLHCGNLTTSGVACPPKALAPALNLRFNLNKVGYMLVPAFKIAGPGKIFRTTSS